MARKARTILGIGSNPTGRRTQDTGRRIRRPLAYPASCILHPDGLTLVEVLVSVAILASSTVVILQALARGAYALTAATHRLRAYTFAAQKLADLEVSATAKLPDRLSGDFTSGKDRYHWRIDAKPAEDEPRLTVLMLTVEWRQGLRQQEAQVSLWSPLVLEPDGS